MIEAPCTGRGPPLGVLDGTGDGSMATGNGDELPRRPINGITASRNDRTPWDATGVLDEVRARLRELGQLPADWDDQDGGPVEPETLERAEQLLLEIAERFGPPAGTRIRPSVVAPIPGGGVYLEWRSAQGDLQVDVLKDGQSGYLFVERTGDRPRYTEGENPPHSVIAEYMARVLAAGE